MGAGASGQFVSCCDNEASCIVVDIKTASNTNITGGW
jgi:hypothetical protein